MKKYQFRIWVLGDRILADILKIFGNLLARIWVSWDQISTYIKNHAILVIIMNNMLCGLIKRGTMLMAQKNLPKTSINC